MHSRICQTVLCQLSAETTLCIIVPIPGELILLGHPSNRSSHADPRGATRWLCGISTKRRNCHSLPGLSNKPCPPPEWPARGVDRDRRRNRWSNSKSRRGWCEERLICHGREVFMASAPLFHFRPSAVSSAEASLAVRRQMAESPPASRMRMTINVWQSVSNQRDVRI